MAIGILPNTITRESVGAAIRQLRIAHRHDERKVNALAKAEARLYSCLWQWHSASRTLIVESATKAGITTYVVEHGCCECPASAHNRACWHQTVWEILTGAETLQPRPRCTAEDRECIAREAAELA